MDIAARTALQRKDKSSTGFRGVGQSLPVERVQVPEYLEGTLRSTSG
jgi:hypothetical protein